MNTNPTESQSFEPSEQGQDFWCEPVPLTKQVDDDDTKDGPVFTCNCGSTCANCGSTCADCGSCNQCHH